ncbi:molybdopterin molybdotransferase MoeA [Paludisphaera mucosa]|uniref:Molybdopterin molybdenumtransferase n=1 Tax=Paludisphaera mucosa TaxID=3030827 RepID=A0ABT6F9J4_9BACT|nr:molybdopterin molybdotransferase MoeA [Paludisphaera mucosa]MDG3004151.1 molybdopterin molybdotransferase MoeA [Paludisphaera mucosa]
MLRVPEALARVLEHAAPLPVAERPLENCLGRRLAADVWADADQPPFDKALVDGFAVRCEDLEGLPKRLRLGETILAGQVPSRPLAPGEAATIMTGAPLPSNADAVVMVERTAPGFDSVEILEQAIKPGMNRLPRGRVYRAGDRLLEGGVELTPARMGLLAAAGASRVRIVDWTRSAVVPTGDELVDFREVPGPGRIRNSNALMLETLLARRGLASWTSPILRDEADVLRNGLKRALELDVVLVIGGVSAGQKDLVPATLRELGVREVFHKVRIKPGKPLWFGVGPARSERPPALVFGLPGNPLSGLVNFLIFVAPALDVLDGRPARGLGILPAYSAVRLEHRSDLETYLPVRIVDAHRTPTAPPTVEPVDYGGSADLASVVRADGFLVLPDRETTVEPGEIVGFLPLD